MTALGRRYRDRVDVWSISNEPNDPAFLGPQYRNGRPASPRTYRRLYLAGRGALHATGNGSDLILFGETLPRGGSRTVNPLPSCAARCASTGATARSVAAPSCRMDGYAHAGDDPLGASRSRLPPAANGDDQRRGGLRGPHAPR